jgi:ABC-type ATPase with predicted acetyltransferase domain
MMEIVLEAVSNRTKLFGTDWYAQNFSDILDLLSEDTLQQWDTCVSKIMQWN